MSLFHAVILGIIQGLTEFLPISSSGHLVIVPYLFGWDYQGLGFDVALHWGTLVAVLGYFWKDYLKYIKGFFTSLSVLGAKQPLRLEQKMSWFLILGSIPGAVLGYLLEKPAENAFRAPLVIAIAMAGFGFVLWLVDRKSVRRDQIEHLDWKKVLAIGFSQAVAIVPGVSRSGATMTAGLLCKLDRKSAAEFSFLLSGPIIFGAGLVALKELHGINGALVAGFLAAAVSGVIAIKFLMNYLSSHDFKIFVWYRYVLAAVVIAVLLFR